jgi:hypothetical protein
MPHVNFKERKEKRAGKKVSSTTKRPIIFATPFPTRRRRHNDSNDMKEKRNSWSSGDTVRHRLKNADASQMVAHACTSNFWFLILFDIYEHTKLPLNQLDYN